MKTTIYFSARFRVMMMAAGLSLVVLGTVAQTQYRSADGVKIKVSGTSNIHDWEMNSDKGNCTATFVIAATGAITALNNFSFSMNVRDLNSEHRAMDENCYKALRSDQYPAISYNCGVTAVVPAAGGYTISSKGKLSIGGVTREVAVAAVCSVAADKSITCSGSYKLKMTDYNVTPPGIMFGAIKTGNEVTIKFSFIVRPG